MLPIWEGTSNVMSLDIVRQAMINSSILDIKVFCFDYQYRDMNKIAFYCDPNSKYARCFTLKNICMIK